MGCILNGVEKCLQEEKVKSNNKTKQTPTINGKDKKVEKKKLLKKPIRSSLLRFSTSIEAWEKLNEAFITGDIDGLVCNSKESHLLNLSFMIDNPYLPEDLNLGRYFVYYPHKWVHLIANYISMEELAELKDTIQVKEIVDTPISYHFSNKHKNGKGCLLTMTILYSERKFHLSFHVRSSEITKRLIFDLLLFQRLGEYLLDGKPFDIGIFMSKAFNDNNVLLMYHVHKDIFDILEGRDDNRSNNLRDKLTWFLEHTADDVRYKIYKRIAKSLKDDVGQYPTLLVKDCKLPGQK